MSDKVTITMSRRQAQMVQEACEQYCRLCMGQFGGLADQLAEYLYPDSFDDMLTWRDAFRSECERLYSKAPMRPIPEDALAVETVWLAIRSKFAWERNPDGDPMDVRFDPVRSRCDEKVPEVTLHD